MRAALLLLSLAACAAPPSGQLVLGERAALYCVDAWPALYCVDAWPAPEGVDPVHARGAYLHPIATPSGRVATGDYPPSHPHQHGVQFAWTRAQVEGRPLDFWNTGAGQGTLRVASARASGDRLHAVHEFVEVATDQVVLTDTWNVTLVPHPAATVVDVRSTQRATGAPFEVLEYHYGGFAARGHPWWEAPKERCEVLTSAGHDREGADGERVRWCAMTGELIGGGRATLAVLAHPGNPRAPQPVRVHPEVPYFCFSPCRLGGFEITRERPWVNAYRVVATDGAPDAALLDALWEEFAAAPAR